MYNNNITLYYIIELFFFQVDGNNFTGTKLDTYSLKLYVKSPNFQIVFIIKNNPKTPS